MSAKREHKGILQKVNLSDDWMFGQVMADEELKALLKYVENSTTEAAEESQSRLVRRIHEKIEEIRRNEEKEWEYMLFMERLEELQEDAMERGLERGLEQGVEMGERRMKRLIQKLHEDGRESCLMAMLSDDELRQQLYEEYNIE